MQLGLVDGETIGSKLVPQQGVSPVGAPSPGGWTTTSSTVGAVAPTVTLAAGSAGTSTLDWSRFGIFPFLMCQNATGTSAFTLAFTNVTVGQTIWVITTQFSTNTACTVTYPTGCIAMHTAGTTQALSAVNSAVDCILITCISPGNFVAVWN
jgi:hypothetical protein